MLWLVEHAGELLTKHSVGHDGRTGFERRQASPPARMGTSFLELVYDRVRPAEMDRSLSPRS
eukprot:12325150-Alexandrium_andersonii.AAC.1